MPIECTDVVMSQDYLNLKGVCYGVGWTLRVLQAKDNSEAWEANENLLRSGVSGFFLYSVPL